VDDAIMWTLERDPARRPASADELRRAMESAGAEVGPMSAHDLGGWMRAALAERLTERTTFERQCVAEMREERSASGESPAMNLHDSGSRSGGFSAVSRPGLADVRQLPVPQPIGLSPPPSEGDSTSHPAYSRYQPASTGSAVPPTVHSRHRTALGVTGAAVLLAGGIAVAWQVGSSSAPAPASAAKTSPRAPAPQVRSLPPSSGTPARHFEVALTVEPSHAVIELDGVKVGSGSFRTTMPVDGTHHILTVRAAGYEAVGLDFVDRPPPPVVVLDQLKSPPERASRRPAPRNAQASSRRDRPDRARAPAKAPQRAPAKEKVDDPVTDNPDPWAEGGED
jgi:hypothetical protein